MPSLSVELAPKLFDLFQHCELRCSAACCGWDAFDFSDGWLSRWCDSRDASIISATRLDILRIRDLIGGYDHDAKFDLYRFFTPTAATLVKRLELIDNALARHGELHA